MPKPLQPPGKTKKDKNDPPLPEPDPTPTPQPDPTFNGRIVVDPITRIEGHLKIETEVENGTVTSAWSTGMLFRGIETILKGRNPEDAWLFTQRLCGVCTYVHGSTSVRCVEDAAGVTIPENARIIRNCLMGAQYLHDHPVHFYHLHALDWVDIVSALSADPGATANLAGDVTPNAPAIDFAAVQARLKNFVDSGQLGPFANAYWGHPAYKLPPEANLLLAAHYLEALKMQAKTARLHAIFGGKNPHVQSLRVGGVTCRQDINNARINEFRGLLNEAKNFIDTVYVPDTAFLANFYAQPENGDWANIGGNDNFLACGEFPMTSQEPQSLFFPQGVIFGRNLNDVKQLDTAEILEHAQHSWYQNNTALHPSVGETDPNYTGYNPDASYSWLKAPRYRGEPMEVGPLARMLVAYGSGMAKAQGAINGFLLDTGLSESAMFSVLGRVAARALETQIIAHAMDNWLDELVRGIGRNAYQPTPTPVSGTGMGLNEAPRGALGHWIDIQNQQIANYQMVVPSTWNFGPRCDQGKPGPMEQALVEVPVFNMEKPLEILRTVHSLDPCIACAVHVIDPESDRAYEIRVL
ncbi:MAG: nickel-dependent hydrogenase large subunit [Desulfobacterales bacterium]|jgi:[NiFe] hydrogenase large subunit